MVESDFAESMLTTSSFHVLNVSAKNVKNSEYCADVGLYEIKK